MNRYYKIPREWAERLGETQTAVQHPDGMYLVLPSLGLRISESLAADNGGARLLPAEAFEAIGAIGLTVAEAQASARGELRHDNPENPENPDNPENPENPENP